MPDMFIVKSGKPIFGPVTGGPNNGDDGNSGVLLGVITLFNLSLDVGSVLCFCIVIWPVFNPDI